jgi:ribosomal protein L3 glutamine methyltransferase
MTLIECITSASDCLRQENVSFGHGTTNSFDEAVWLSLWALHLPLDSLDEHAKLELTLVQLQTIQALIEKRIQTRKPAAYLTQEAWLQNIPFYVDERSIIPRSFIAELLVDEQGEGVLDAWLSEQTHRVLDLCTGNGSLAILAAMIYPDVQVEASDISHQALAVAKINVEKHGLMDRVHLIHSDLFDHIDKAYDLIVCNPPYVNTSSMNSLPLEYQHEPALALAGGTDGMDLIRRIVQQAVKHLSPNGVLVLELGHERAHFEQAFPRLEAAWLSTCAGEDQVLLLTRDALLSMQNKH